MRIFGKRVAGLGLALAATFALGGCYEDGYYGGVSAGYGSGGYYGDPWYGGYPSYGWYDGFYYPGRGYWLYDRNGARHRWNDHHRRYWEGRRHHDGERHGAWREDRGRPDNGEWRGNRGERRVERERAAIRGERMSRGDAETRAWRTARGQRAIEQRSAPRAERGDRSGRGFWRNRDR